MYLLNDTACTCKNYQQMEVYTGTTDRKQAHYTHFESWFILAYIVNKEQKHNTNYSYKILTFTAQRHLWFDVNIV